MSVIVKSRPLLRVLPGAALTAGGAVSLQGGTSIRNLDRVTDGVLVEAGGNVQVGGDTRLMSLPGSPAVNAIVPKEASLDALVRQNNDGRGVFNAFFGMPQARYRKSFPVKIVEGADPSARAQSLMAAYQQGYRAFYAEESLVFDTASIGTAERPLLLVSKAPIGCNQACQFRGLIYNDRELRGIDTGTGIRVDGAVITRGDHHQSSGDSINYDMSSLSSLRRQTSLFVRIPGSWRDF